MKPLLVFLFATLLIASCNPDAIDLSEGGQSSETRAINTAELQDMPDTLQRLGDALVPMVYVDLGVSYDLGVAVKVPVIPDVYIEPAGLVEQFRELAKFTNGEESYVDVAREITKTFIGILDSHLVDNTDLVFMIDGTSSMADDIENVKRGVTTIIKHVEMKKNVRVGIAVYRDVEDGRIWYHHLPLTHNYDSVITYVNRIMAYGGGADWPESVYDAAYITMDTMEWREQSPKMMLILGDAPALLGSRTTYTLSDVVEKSKATLLLPHGM